MNRSHHIATVLVNPKQDLALGGNINIDHTKRIKVAKRALKGRNEITQSKYKHTIFFLLGAKAPLQISSV